MFANKQLLFGVMGVAILAFIAIFAPYMTPYAPWEQNIDESFYPPSFRHPFGTDSLGRDLLSRVMFGTRVSLIVAVFASGGSALVGIIMGSLGGYFGGLLDHLIQGCADIAWSFPPILMAFFFIPLLEPGLTTTVLAIVMIFWAQFARIVRSKVLSTREQEYVLAAQAIGGGHLRICGKHILPNVIGPVIVLISLTSGRAIIISAMLSFLGLGIQPPQPSWGIIISDGRDFIASYPWIATFPGIAISFAVLSLNFLGDGLRDFFDPRTVA